MSYAQGSTVPEADRGSRATHDGRSHGSSDTRPASTAAIPVDDPGVLVQHLDDPGRRLPAVILSHTGGVQPYGVSPKKLADDLADLATVWTLRSVDTAWQLSGLNPDYATYGGAVRVVGPAGESDVIRTDKNPERVSHRIRAAVVRTAPADAEPGLRPARHEPAPHDTHRDTRHVASHHDHDDLRRIKELEQQIARLDHENERLRRRVATAERRVCTHHDPDPTSPVFTDPERQLRYEIGEAWLHHLPENDRRDWPLREYTFGAKFLAGMETQLVSRSRIIVVIVDVLTRRAFGMPARGVHTHSAGHPAADNLVRPDGATAYRAYVRKNTPGAPRLLWWEHTDNTVELAWVGHHDDPMPGH